MRQRAYYNDIDPFCCQWLRNLMAAGLIMEGDIDERSIKDVQPEDLAGYERCHFFAGVGGWDYALQLAGWTGPVWTGSCPCQSLSCAGKRLGEKDERHLWPEFYRLISECRPPTVFGEQVASKDGVEWLDGVSLDLEELGYAVGQGDLPAAGIGAPHIRQRIYWMAHAECGAAERQGFDLATATGATEGGTQERERLWADSGAGGDIDGLAQSDIRPNRESHGLEFQRGRSSDSEQTGLGSGVDRLGFPDSERPQPGRLAASIDGHGSAVESAGGIVRLGNSGSERLEGCRINERTRLAGTTQAPTAHWNPLRLTPCRDGKVRRISAQSSDVPLAYGIPVNVGRVFPVLAGLAKGARRNRVGRLKGYGNAIVPEVAAEFVMACQLALFGDSK